MHGVMKRFCFLFCILMVTISWVNAAVPVGGMPVETRWIFTPCKASAISGGPGTVSTTFWDPQPLVYGLNSTIGQVKGSTGYTGEAGVYNVADARECFFKYPNHYLSNGVPLGQSGGLDLYMAPTAEDAGDLLDTNELGASCYKLKASVELNTAVRTDDGIDPNTGVMSSLFVSAGARVINYEVMKNPKRYSAACLYEVSIPSYNSMSHTVLAGFYQAQLSCPAGTWLSTGYGEPMRAPGPNQRVIYPLFGDKLNANGIDASKFYCILPVGGALDDKNPGNTHGNEVGDVSNIVNDGAADLTIGGDGGDGGECRR